MKEIKKIIKQCKTGTEEVQNHTFIATKEPPDMCTSTTRLTPQFVSPEGVFYLLMLNGVWVKFPKM